jgi:hypothetical protein
MGYDCGSMCLGGLTRARNALVCADNQPDSHFLRDRSCGERRPETMKISWRFSVFSFQPSLNCQLPTAY